MFSRNVMIEYIHIHQVQTKLQASFLLKIHIPCVPPLPTEYEFFQISTLEMISNNSTFFQQTILVGDEYFLMYTIHHSSNSHHLPWKF